MSETVKSQPTANESEAQQARAERRAALINESVVTLAAFVLAFLIGAVLMIVSDPNVISKFSYFFTRPGDALSASWLKVSHAYAALFTGSLGSFSAITETTAQAAPLICAGLGLAVGFRAGLFNIGAQGQAILGSIIAAYIGFSFHLPMAIHLPFAIIAGMLFGALWAGLAGVLRAKFGAHEVIVTIMLNYVATGLLSWLLTTPAFLRPGRTDPISPLVDWTVTLPRLEGNRLHFGFVLALLAAVAVWWLLDHTRLGFEIKAVGINPKASATAGMSVSKALIMAMVISGLLTGLAGVQAALAPDVNGTPTPLTVGLVGSIGFDAITVALLGRSKPLGTVLAGILFGGLHAGSLAMQAMASTPYELANVLQALIVMFVAAPMLVRTLMPFLKRRARPQSATAAAVPAAATVGGLTA